MADELPSGTPPRALVLTAAVLGGALAVGVAVLGLSQREEAPPPLGPLALVGVDAPEASSAACASLAGALPEALPSGGESLPRRALADPAPPAAAGWGAQETVVLRCGLAAPAELRPDSQLQVVNGVQWLPVPGAGTTTFFTVDRDVFVALTVPLSAGTGPLQAISDAVSQSLRPVPPRF